MSGYDRSVCIYVLCTCVYKMCIFVYTFVHLSKCISISIHMYTHINKPHSLKLEVILSLRDDDDGDFYLVS